MGPRPHHRRARRSQLEIAAHVLARYPGAVDRVARTVPALAAEIAARGQAAHQEGLIPALTRDLSRFVLGGGAYPGRMIRQVPGPIQR